jgi:hypothetical protein
MTTLRWLVKAHATTILRKSSRLVAISSKIYYSQIYLLNSNFIHMILNFQLSCMKNFKIPHLIYVTNPTINTHYLFYILKLMMLNIDCSMLWFFFQFGPSYLFPFSSPSTPSDNWQLTMRASASHCQIDCQISFDNCHLNFRNVKTRQN